MAVSTDLAAAESAIRARLVEIVEDVTGVSSQVHDYWRNINDEAKRLALMKDELTGALHVWFVSLAFDGTLDQDRGLLKSTLLYDLHGYYAVKDDVASEKTFAGKVLDVVTKFNNSPKLRLNGSELASPAIRDSGPAMLAEFNSGEITNVLVHHARIQLPVAFNAGTC